MTTRPRRDPYRQFNFVVEINGVALGGFAEVTGLNTDINAVDDRAGRAAPPGVRALPGLRKQAHITLQRGAANRQALFEWHANDAANRRGATIVLLDAAHQPAARWHLANAWISKIVGPSLNATGNDVAIESLELTHEGIEPEP